MWELKTNENNDGIDKRRDERIRKSIQMEQKRLNEDKDGCVKGMFKKVRLVR